uniref:Ubiquitin-like domain-containing protein n=1 Tax=Panagrolaimus sp. PS1159 TaxID=55785 RepID=A0AC35EZW9_9BILA
MSASVKLRFFDEDGVPECSKRFSMSGDISTVAESMQKGLDSLKCPPLQCQLNLYGLSRGRLEDSICVPATTPASVAAILPPPTPTAMAATSPPAVPTSMAAALPPSTSIAMAAPPPPYDRVLMDDGSAEPSTSAAAYTFYISKKQAVNDFHGSNLNMDGKNEPLSSSKNSICRSCSSVRKAKPCPPDSSRESPSAKRAEMAAATDSETYLLSTEFNPETDSNALHCVYERTSTIKDLQSFRCLVPAPYEEARVPGMSTTTTVYDSTDKRHYMAGWLITEICKCLFSLFFQ